MLRLNVGCSISFSSDTKVVETRKTGSSRDADEQVATILIRSLAANTKSLTLSALSPDAHLEWQTITSYSPHELQYLWLTMYLPYFLPFDLWLSWFRRGWRLHIISVSEINLVRRFHRETAFTIIMPGRVILKFFPDWHGQDIFCIKPPDRKSVV